MMTPSSIIVQNILAWCCREVEFAYVYAVALNSTGNSLLAIDVLQDVQIRFPQDSEILNALIAFHRDAGNEFAAQKIMNKLKKLNQK